VTYRLSETEAGWTTKKKRWQGRLPFAVNEEDEDEECDVFSGSWVKDEAAHPLYREEECPYIPPQLTCQAQGRPDRGYQSWRWQPHDCTLPAYVSLSFQLLASAKLISQGVVRDGPEIQFARLNNPRICYFRLPNTD
jgi:hypothetical protein